MGDASAFLEIERRTEGKEPVSRRLSHYRELYIPLDEEGLRKQASRCLDCGVPFCHGFGCPLGNLAPEWNDLVYRGRWEEACARLHLTNNFPEFTGRICPAPCEAACTLGNGDQAVTIRQIELAIVERGWSQGWIKPLPPAAETGKTAAVVGSGPAGLAAAQELRRAGHQVTVFEKAPLAGGLLRFGIPDFKLEKHLLDRRIAQMREEGVAFELGVEVGRDISAEFLRRRFDAICLAVGCQEPRDLTAPGRELDGIHFAMDFLVRQNLRLAGLPVAGPQINAAGLKVVIIGGGDTGADCLGTALRQGARSIHQFEIMPKPPQERDPATPWPGWPNMLRSSTSHEEGGERRWCVATTSFEGENGRVKRLTGHEVSWSPTGPNGAMAMSPVEGSGFTMDVDLVLLATGFTQPIHQGLLDGLGLEYDARGNIKTGAGLAASQEGVFAAGDAATGAWLVVRAISAGRRAARAMDRYLVGASNLPDTLPPL